MVFYQKSTFINWRGGGGGGGGEGGLDFFLNLEGDLRFLTITLGGELPIFEGILPHFPPAHPHLYLMNAPYCGC